jgi:ABC-type uncharacterized transport system ATPase subunit
MALGVDNPAMSAPPRAAAIVAAGLRKTYPNGVRAVQDVSLSVTAGEIRAIVGENGAGKSTLMKMLYGLEQPTAGDLRLWGEPRALTSPAAAIALGVGMVHQNLMLVPSFTLAENVVLGVEPGPAARVDGRAAIEATLRLVEDSGLTVDPRARAGEVSVGMRQRTEILKALHRGARILILDEPTAVLTPQESRDLFTAIRRLRDGGMTVLFISHKLEEVRAISDGITVMRAGRHVGTVDTADATAASLAAMMIGRELPLDVERRPARPGAVTLRVRGLAHRSPDGSQDLTDIDFDVAAGEIVGLAGVEGNGQSELVELLAGMRRPTAGVIELAGADITGLDVAGRRAAGVAHVPEDRLRNGVALTESVADNLIVDRHARPPIGERGRLLTGAVRVHVDRLIRDYAVRTPDRSVPVGALSGGNVQKVVVARELSSRPRLLLAAQLTRGVDIGAMRFIHDRVVEARDEGAAVLLVSADLGELLSLADRLLVIKDGRLVARFDDLAGVSDTQVGSYMLGVERHDHARIRARLDDAT